MFYIEDGRKSFYQWDLNRRLVIDNPLMIEVHYHISAKEPALICEVYEENSVRYADVPNIILQTAGRFRVYGCCEDYTVEQAQYEIVARAKPSEYVYTETEVRRWEDLQAKFDELVRQCEETIYVPEDHKIRIEQLEKATEEAAQLNAKKFEALEAADVSLQENIQTNKLSIQTLETDLSAAIQTLEKDLSAAIQTLGDDLSVTINTIGELGDEVRDIQDNQNYMKDDLDFLKQEVNDLHPLHAEIGILRSEIPELSKKVNDHGHRLDRLESRINTDDIYTTKETSLFRLVPQNACPYAQIDAVGGFTYKGTKQLIPFDSYAYEDKKQTINGVTWTIRNGEIIVNGKAGTGGSVLELYNGDALFKDYDDYTFSGIPKTRDSVVGAEIQCFSETDGLHWSYGPLREGWHLIPPYGNKMRITLKVAQNATVNNLVLKPMFNKGRVAETNSLFYDSYHLTHNYLDKIVVHGANLYDSSSLMSQGESSNLGSDFRLFKNAEDILFNNLNNIPWEITVSFVARSLTYSSSKPQILIEIYYSDLTRDTLEFCKTGLNTYKITSKPGKAVSYITMSGNNNGTFDLGKIMVNWGEQMEYVPYAQSNTIPLKKTFEKASNGVDDYYHDVYKNGQIIYRTKTEEFDGSENWILYATSNTSPKKYIYYIDLWDKTEGIYSTSKCNDFTNVEDVYSSSLVINNAKAWTYSDDKYGSGAYFVSNMPMNEWKAWLGERKMIADPLKLVYGTDWSTGTEAAEYDKFFLTNPGGMIECVSNHGLSVPVTLTYLRKEGA